MISYHVQKSNFSIKLYCRSEKSPDRLNFFYSGLSDRLLLLCLMGPNKVFPLPKTLFIQKTSLKTPETDPIVPCDYSANLLCQATPDYRRTIPNAPG